MTKFYPALLFRWNYRCLEISCVTNIISTMTLHQVKPIVKNCESLSIVWAVAEISFQLPGGTYVINWGLERTVQASFTPPSQQGIGLYCQGILAVHPGGKRWNRGNLWPSIPNYLSRRGTVSSKLWSAPWYALCSNENFYIFLLLEALWSMQLHPVIVCHRIVLRIKPQKFYQRSLLQALGAIRWHCGCSNSVCTVLDTDWNWIRITYDLDFKPEMWWIKHCCWVQQTYMLQQRSAGMLNCKVWIRPSSVRKMHETRHQQQLLLMLFQVHVH